MNRRVLLVGDDEAGFDTLRQPIVDDGYDAKIVCRGEECLEVLRTFLPDVLVMEASLPGIDGFEVCRRIKSEPGNETLVIILVSDTGTSEERVEGYQVGAVDCLVKPVDPSELVGKIGVLFRLKSALNAMGEARDAVQKHNSKLERVVRERTEEIVATRDVTVFALAKLAESRDPETGEHLERMRRYTQILGEELSKNGPYVEVIDATYLDDLYRSSPLHDIGKVGIPDAILLKPGPLKETEFEVMKTHTIIGAQALETAMQQWGSASFLTMAAEIARCHHERYDGTGYPAGLKGDDIPLAARVVALPDMFDALTSERVYKKAYLPDVARELILHEEGKHFDPAVVKAFRASYQKFLDVHQRSVEDEKEPSTGDAEGVTSVFQEVCG